jgi:hypothetical protein
MPGLEIRIPKERAGRPLQESRVKAGLKTLNPSIFFDVGSRLGMDHPYMDYRQGVYYDGFPDGRKHVCSMDRGHAFGGVIIEVPVWSTINDLVEVPLESVVFESEEIVMPLMHKPDYVQVKRQVRNEVILCGWRHTFDKLIAARIPGITRESLAGQFGVSLDAYVEPVEVPEEGDAWDSDIDPDQPVMASSGEIV